MEDLNFTGICWKENTAGQKQCRRFLEWIDDNSLDTDDGGTDEGRCFAGPDTHKQGRTGWGCEGLGQPQDLRREKD